MALLFSALSYDGSIAKSFVIVLYEPHHIFVDSCKVMALSFSALTFVGSIAKTLS